MTPISNRLLSKSTEDIIRYPLSFVRFSFWFKYQLEGL